MLNLVTTTNVPISAISLEEYWEFLQINEIAGYGIRNFPTTGALGMGCGDYWNQTERYYLASALRLADNRLEADRWLGFPLRAKNISRQAAYATTLNVGKYLREFGIDTWELVDDVAVTLRVDGVIQDPVVFTVPVTFTDINELVIAQPSTTYSVIKPSAIIIEAGVATVTIPRCRLLKSAYFKNYVSDNERPNYTVDTNFYDTVSVYRNYMAPTGVELIWWKVPHLQNIFPGVTVCNCGDFTTCDVKQMGRACIQEQRFGRFTVEPFDGTNLRPFALHCPPNSLALHYKRGYLNRYDVPEPTTLRMIIAIAHNNLPRKYCTCDQQKLYYDTDVKPLEPPVRLGLGQSTWGLYEAEQLIREFDAKQGSFRGGLL